MHRAHDVAAILAAGGGVKGRVDLESSGVDAESGRVGRGVKCGMLGADGGRRSLERHGRNEPASS